MSNILVIGGTGFIGSELCQQLCEDNKNNVVVLLHDLKPEHLHANHAVSWCDITAPDAVQKIRRVLEQYQIEHVYHLAALPLVQQGDANPAQIYQTNIMGTVNVLQACDSCSDVTNVLILSTDKVYGEGENKKTTDAFHPNEPYGLSKTCADMIAQQYMSTAHYHTVIIRSCNVFGYDPYHPQRIIPYIITNMLQNKPIKFRHPRAQRQYVYVKDLVRLLIKYIKFDDGIYNIGTPWVYNPVQLLDLVAEQFYLSQTKYEHVDDLMLEELDKQSVAPSLPETFTPMDEALRHTIACYSHNLYNDIGVMSFKRDTS